MNTDYPLAFLQAQLLAGGSCMNWNAIVIWLQVVSDAVIVLAFASLAFLLPQAIRTYRASSRQLFFALSAFALASGSYHVISIASVWMPLYWPESIVKCVAAMALVTSGVYFRRRQSALFVNPHDDELIHDNEALAQANLELQHRSAELVDSYAALKSSYEAQLDSETQFRQLADSMPQVVWTANQHGFVTHYNERWYSFTGIDRKLLGDQSWMPLIHPDDIQRRVNSWYESVRSGLPFKEEYRYYDRATATYRWHLGRALPIKNEAGIIVRWFGACTDIDDYKRAEDTVLSLNSQLESRVVERTQELTRANEELRRAQSWLKTILQSATEVSIMALDNNGVISFFNSGTERLLGYRAEDLVGKCTPHILYPPEQSELRARQMSAQLNRTITVDEIFLAANLPKESTVSESIYLHRDGTPIDVSLAISPMIDSKGERLGKLAIAVDMRPRKVLEKQLTRNNLELQLQTKRAEQASLAKTNFLSAVSHEIRTPMNAILGMADLLWQTELAETQRRYVEVFRRAGTNLLSLVNDILDLSKIESGRFDLEKIDFNLHDVIEMTLDMIRPKVEAKNLTLDLVIEPDTPSALVGDPTRLQQILGNLLSNAVKFTERGTIRLLIKPSPLGNHRLCFEVTDTGIGIPEDKLESIFEDFTQAESSTTRRFGGTGLGLGICKRLVGRMGGTLSVTSRLGEGSTFYFDAVFLAPSGLESSRAELATSLTGCRVLIVDDNRINRLIFVEMCNDWGMQTTECDNSGDVLGILEAAAAADKPFHAVIVDRLMNRMDGIQLATKIRQIYPKLAILVISSDNTSGDQTRVLGLGVADYAIKPVRSPELLRIIRKLLNVNEVREPAQRQPALRPAVAAGRIRILIAEDSEDNCYLLEEYLKESPYELVFAANGEMAVDLAASQSFDLILMDMQMPLMDGLTASRLVRKAELAQGRQRTPLLAFSANAHREEVDSSRAAGCDDHLSKPISKPELLRAIAKYARRVHAPLEAQITPEIAAAARGYLSSRRNEIARLSSLVHDNDFDQIRSLAHNMMGTGTSSGFPDVTRLGGLIEASANDHDVQRLSTQILELAACIQKAEQSLLSSHPLLC